MIKGLAITPPVLGRISIGKIVEKNGKRLLKRMINLPLPAKSKIKMAGSNIHWMNNYVPKHRIKTKSSEAFQSV
jgi:hypothetical protein